MKSREISFYWLLSRTVIKNHSSVRAQADSLSKGKIMFILQAMVQIKIQEMKRIRNTETEVLSLINKLIRNYNKEQSTHSMAVKQ